MEYQPELEQEEFGYDGEVIVWERWDTLEFHSVSDSGESWIAWFRQEAGLELGWNLEE